MTTGEHPSRRLERRWAPRYSFRAELEIEWGSAVLRGKTREYSGVVATLGVGYSLGIRIGRTIGIAGTKEQPTQHYQ